MSDEHKPAGYQVGYGKPPKQHQFKPGQSGNPNGSRGRKRKPAPTSFSDIMKEALLKKQVVTIDGRRRRMSRFEVIAENMTLDAMRRDHESQKQVLRQAAMIDKNDRLYPKAAEGPRKVVVSLSLGDEEISERIARQLYEDKLRAAREAVARGEPFEPS